MNKNRRNFIKAAAIATVFAGTDLFASLALAAGNNSTDFAPLPAETLADPFLYLTAEDFKKHIGAQFTLIGKSDARTAELMSVAQTVKPFKSAERLKTDSGRKVLAENFTLSFRALTGDFTQATYRLWNPSLGEFNLFLVPVASKSKNTLLHAVINRI